MSASRRTTFRGMRDFQAIGNAQVAAKQWKAPQAPQNAFAGIELVLPFPPPVNTYYRHPHKGPMAGMHLLSEDARSYRSDVEVAVMAQIKLPLPRLTNRLEVEIEVSAPDRRHYDIDGRLKALLDSLEHAGVYVDDEQIDRITIERAPPCTTGYAKVKIRALE